MGNTGDPPRAASEMSVVYRRVGRGCNWDRDLGFNGDVFSARASGILRYRIVGSSRSTYSISTLLS